VGVCGSSRLGTHLGEIVDTRSCRAPDGAVVSIVSSVPTSSGLNFSARVALPVIGSVPFGVACGRGLADYQRVMSAELPRGFMVTDVREVTLHGRRLATATVVAQQASGIPAVTSRWAGWEGGTACLSTSRKSATHDDLVALLARTPFHESENHPGVVFDAPLDNTVAPVTGTMFLPLVGVLEVRPRIPEVNALLPAGRGATVSGGELFRTGRHSDTLLLLGESAVASIRPVGRTAAHTLGFASTLKVSWLRAA
jgi:hypothetical protein